MHIDAYNSDMISAESASDQLCQPLHNKRLGLYFVSFVRSEAACVLFSGLLGLSIINYMHVGGHANYI